MNDHWMRFFAVMVGVVGVPLLHLAARISKAWTDRRKLPMHLRLHLMPTLKNARIWRDIDRESR